jgi:alkanesulfonate monooxygenase
MESVQEVPIELFSTCPQFAVEERSSYLQRVIGISNWSERAGCKGILIYSDNSQVDPWLLSEIIIQNTKSLSPLVAIQPIYMHPYTVAKMVATLGHLFQRRVYLNMVAGGFKNDLTSLHDTPHDERYARLSEYTTIIRQLLTTPAAASHDGRYYQIQNLKMTPALDPELAPGIFVSGSSDAGLAAAQALGATAIHYPEPAKDYLTHLLDDSISHGIRIGIIARESEEDAWQVAYSYFPEDRKGQITQQLAMKVSDSVWHKRLSQVAEVSERNPYWLSPFQNYKTFCPYLVGSYEQVAAELEVYIRAGMRKFILDIPRNEEDLLDINVAFQLARSKHDNVQAIASLGNDAGGNSAADEKTAPAMTFNRLAEC